MDACGFQSHRCLRLRGPLPRGPRRHGRPAPWCPLWAQLPAQLGRRAVPSASEWVLTGSPHTHTHNQGGGPCDRTAPGPWQAPPSGPGRSSEPGPGPAPCPQEEAAAQGAPRRRLFGETTASVRPRSPRPEERPLPAHTPAGPVLSLRPQKGCPAAPPHREKQPPRPSFAPLGSWFPSGLRGECASRSGGVCGGSGANHGVLSLAEQPGVRKGNLTIRRRSRSREGDLRSRWSVRAAGGRQGQPEP